MQVGNYDYAFSGAMCVSCPADETLYFLLLYIQAVDGFKNRWGGQFTAKLWFPETRSFCFCRFSETLIDSGFPNTLNE